MTLEQCSIIAEENWPVKFLKEYEETEQLPIVAGVEEERLDTELNRLLAKQNNFPPVSFENKTLF